MPVGQEVAEERAQDLMAALVRAIDHSPLKKSTKDSKRKSVHWWSPEIRELRKESHLLRWLHQRKKRRCDDCEEEYNVAKSAKLVLVSRIKRAIKTPWAGLCAIVDMDP